MKKAKTFTNDILRSDINVPLQYTDHLTSIDGSAFIENPNLPILDESILSILATRPGRWSPLLLKGRNYGNQYLISDQGDLFSIKRKKFLKPNIHPEYYQAKISVNGNVMHVYIHTAVAEAFVEKPDTPIEGRTVVNHIDGNKLNNCSSNLEWVSQHENVQKGMVTHPRSTFRKVMCLNTGEIFPSIAEATRRYGIEYWMFNYMMEKGKNAIGTDPDTGEVLMWQYV